MGYQDHQQQITQRSVSCAVLTVSDTRNEHTDSSGRAIQDMLLEAGHTVCHYVIVRDDAEQIRRELGVCAGRADCQAVLLNGGTGISPRDGTVEVVASMLDKKLDGFGELFRMLSYREVGAGAMLSRAIGGIMAGRVVFSMPGSGNAVQVAMTRLILPELAHLVWELRR